jgi:hypothetical protein
MSRLVLTTALLTLAVALPAAWSQTAVEYKKDLLPIVKKLQAEGKDLGEFGEEYKQGDEAIKNGLQDEAIEHFKKAKALAPK